MTRALIPIGECGLLSRRNALRYCGQLGEEKFDRIVAPHVRARLLGGRRFYSRKELDAWIDGMVRPDHPTAEQLLAGLGDAPGKRRQAKI